MYITFNSHHKFICISGGPTTDSAIDAVVIVPYTSEVGSAIEAAYSGMVCFLLQFCNPL